MKEFLGEFDSDQCSPERANTFDIEYHRFLGKLSHNQIVERIYNFVIELFTQTINLIHEGVREAHHALHEALLARDTERAVKCVRTHADIWVLYLSCSSHLQDVHALRRRSKHADFLCSSGREEKTILYFELPWTLLVSWLCIFVTLVVRSRT